MRTYVKLWNDPHKYEHMTKEYTSFKRKQVGSKYKYDISIKNDLKDIEIRKMKHVKVNENQDRFIV